MYDHQYKAVLDGKETESMMEIHPTQLLETFKMGNATDEVLEVHDFKNVRGFCKRPTYFSYAAIHILIIQDSVYFVRTIIMNLSKIFH